MAEIKVSDYLKTNYDDYYDGGDSEWRRIGARSKANNIVRICGNVPHDSILEIGAGEGAVLQRLSELNFGHELYALEISSTGVHTILTKKIPRLIECKLFDGYQVPYEDDRFDLVILSHVIEHVEHPRILLDEASRVSRHVFVEVPLEDTVRLPRDYAFDKVGHINYYSPKTIRRLLQTCHLDVLEQIITHPPKASYIYQKGKLGLCNYYLKEVLVRLSPRLATALLTYHASLLCRRHSAT